jgi:hypothetical protein
VITMAETGDHDPEMTDHDPRNGCSRWSETSDHDGAKWVFTIGRNTHLFTNFQSNNYWSGTQYAPNTNSAWSFSFEFGPYVAASFFKL